MLKLVDITKDYRVADTAIRALKGVSIEFRENEFVSILGQSGCGKTTLLNIIGGLDHYTTGDLIINNKSTKEYKDRDWDKYRNHSVGFVFQNYNLIPHLTVLGNVELALTLSGINKEERKRRATEALSKVGLSDQLTKKPNQMSGGQMQRVAIARALVNNPDIILADEPTGALDTKTSVQIMEILKEVAKDKLVIMVTHNPELADEYSNRIIRLLDGEVVSDSNPYDSQVNSAVVVQKNENKTSMSFFTALSLSFKNLITKKGRTFITAFAGSIGIIGIALILSLSDGFQNYINRVQKDTLSTYPITIEQAAVDYSSFISAMSGNANSSEIDPDSENIYTNSMMINMFATVSNSAKLNNLKKFKTFLDNDTDIKEHISSIQYTYDFDLNIYDGDNDTQLNPTNIFADLMYKVMVEKNKLSEEPMSDAQLEAYFKAMPMGSSSFDLGIWSEMLDNQSLLDSQYDLIAGSWPTGTDKYKQIVLVADEFNQVNDYALYALGLKTSPTLDEIASNMVNNPEYQLPSSSISFSDVLNKNYKLALTADYYDKQDGKWINKQDDTEYISSLLDSDDVLDLEVVGIIRPKAGVSATSINGSMAYTKELVNYVIDETRNCEVVKEQLATPDTNVFTGLKFDLESNTYTIDDVKTYLASTMADKDKGAMFAEYIVSGLIQQIVASGQPEEVAKIAIIEMFKEELDSITAAATYVDNLIKLNVIDRENPTSISIYCKDFEAKDNIEVLINNYNNNVAEDDQITYSDYIGIMMSSISTIIDAITYVLIGFVAISLIVSSIMIGIITYISVLERTKEIGVLRSIGASKKDISRVFNAETLIIGFSAGMLGIIITLLLNIPINLIINLFANIGNVAALPWLGGVILVVISMLLTLIAGILPSRIASKKDPVEALRSE